MKEKNICKKCPEGIRGLCCYYNIVIEGYNLILLNQPCKYLDLKTMRCKDFKHRTQINPYCLHGKEMFNKGCLPKGCLYLKDHPEREKNPKIDIHEVIDKLSPQSIMKWNVWNNISNIEKFAIKSDE